MVSFTKRNNALCVFGLHCWVQDDFFDVLVISEEHDQPVNAQTPSSSWWQTVLECLEEVLIHTASFVVTSCLGLCLLLEASALPRGVVQLSVSIANLSLQNESLKSFCKTRFGSVPLGQGTHDLGMLGDETWIHNTLLNEMTTELVQETSSSPGSSALHSVLNAKIVENFN